MVLTPSVTSEENVHHVVLYRQQFTRSTPVLVKMSELTQRHSMIIKVLKIYGDQEA